MLNEDREERWKKCELNTGLLKHILSILADETGFLQEKKLDILLEPYNEKEKLLVRLDNVLSALGLTKPEDIDFLVNCLLPYATCPICESNGENEQTGSNNDVPTEISNVSNCSFNHPLMIQKVFVLKGVRDFVTRLHGGKADDRLELVKDRPCISQMLSQEDVEAYWSRFQEIFPPEELKLWHSLQKGLVDYYAALRERQQLAAKEETLRRQNEELKSLVDKYVPKEELVNFPSIFPESTESSSRDNFGLKEIIRRIAN